MSETSDLIIRALEKGPLYEGLIEHVVGRKDWWTELRKLQRQRKVERDPNNPLTWRVVA